MSSISLLSHIEKRDLSALIVRKEPKKHGTMSYVEGPALEKVPWWRWWRMWSRLELLKAADRLSAAGYRPVQALAILDREEGGRQAIEERGLTLQALSLPAGIWELTKIDELRTFVGIESPAFWSVMRGICWHLSPRHIFLLPRSVSLACG